jgi:hypothetical protein
MFSINLSKARKGKKIKKSSFNNNIVKLITPEIKSKLSLRNKGVDVKVLDKSNKLIYQLLDKSNKLIYQLPIITKTAKFFNISTKTISRIYYTGKPFDDFIYKFNVKDNRI